MSSRTLVASLIASFFVGWIGKSRGWILGLITQLIITLNMILFFQLNSFITKIINEGVLGFLNSFLRYIFIQLPWFLFASIGGYFGEKIRRRESLLGFNLMKKENLKKDIIATIIGILIWLFFSLFSHKIDDLIINKEFYKYYPLFSLWTYLLIVSLVASFFVGWIGKSRGWILGLNFQLIITLVLVLFFLFNTSVQEDLTEKGHNFANAFLRYITKQLPWFLSASVGGHLGEMIRRRKINE